MNRAYPENANIKNLWLSTFKFHTFCARHKIKKCWKFELDILNTSGDIAIQKYIGHIMKCCMGLQMSNFLILHPTGLLY